MACPSSAAAGVKTSSASAAATRNRAAMGCTPPCWSAVHDGADGPGDLRRVGAVAEHRGDPALGIEEIDVGRVVHEVCLEARVLEAPIEDPVLLRHVANLLRRSGEADAALVEKDRQNTRLNSR